MVQQCVRRGRTYVDSAKVDGRHGEVGIEVDAFGTPGWRNVQRDKLS